MKSQSITTVIIAALAGAAGATLAHEFLPDREPVATAKQVALVAPELDPAPDYGAQLAQLEQRLATLELRPEPSLRVAAATEPQPASNEAVESFASPSATVAAVADPVLEDHVEQALERIREEERFAREQEKEQKRVEQLENQLAKLETALGLGRDQVNDMRTLYEEQRQTKQDLQSMWEDGFDREALAQAKNDMATRRNSELERILTPQQLETFQQINDKGSRRNSNQRDAARGVRGK
jgi:hypothetical protein